MRPLNNYDDMKDAIYWTKAKEQYTYKKQRMRKLLQFLKASNSKMNFFPGMYEVCTKAKLGTLFRLNAVLFDRNKSVKERFYNFLPRQFIFPQDYQEFRRILEINDKLPESERKVYIYKPDAGNSGRGIILIRELNDIDVISNLGKVKAVVQEYLDKPFTFSDGLKFDLRLYVYIDRVFPYSVYICQEGLCRFCTVPYEKPTSENFNNSRMHLTNFAVNKIKRDRSEHTKSASHSSMLLNKAILDDDENTEHPERGIKKSLTRVFADLRSLEYNVKGLWGKILKLVEYTCATIQPHLYYELNYNFNYNDLPPQVSVDKDRLPSPSFQIIGFDVILTQDVDKEHELHPWLLELNAHPSLKTAYNWSRDGIVVNEISPVDAEIKEKVIEGALSIACDSGRPLSYYEKLSFDNKSEFLMNSGSKLAKIFDNLCSFKNAETIDRLAFYRLCMSVKSIDQNNSTGYKRILPKKQRQSITSSEIDAACSKILASVKTTHYPRTTKLINFDVFCELFLLVFSFENGFEQNTLQATIDTIIKRMHENKLETNKAHSSNKGTTNINSNEKLSLAHSIFLKAQKEERHRKKLRDEEFKKLVLKAKLARNKQGNDTWKKIKKQKQRERLRKQRAIRVEEEKIELHKEKERRKKKLKLG